jgi:hypothetical protein
MVDEDAALEAYVFLMWDEEAQEVPILCTIPPTDMNSLPNNSNRGGEARSLQPKCNGGFNGVCKKGFT